MENGLPFYAVFEMPFYKYFFSLLEFSNCVNVEFYSKINIFGKMNKLLLFLFSKLIFSLLKNVEFLVLIWRIKIFKNNPRKEFSMKPTA